MSRFLPMYSVTFRDPQTGSSMTLWEPVIIIRPVSTTPELAGLTGLPNLSSKLDVERPLFTHNLGIQEVDSLRALIALGFGSEIAAKANIAGKQSKAQASAPHDAAQNPLPQSAPNDQPPADTGSAPSTGEVTPTEDCQPATPVVALIPVCGSRDGFDYLLEADIVAFDGDLDLKALIKAEKLPTVTPKPGYTMIGFPVVEYRGD